MGDDPTIRVDLNLPVRDEDESRRAARILHALSKALLASDIVSLELVQGAITEQKK
jgi:hypothetical protein